MSARAAVHRRLHWIFAATLAPMSLAAAACSSPAPRAPHALEIGDGGGELDLETARRLVADFAIAVVNQNRDEVRRVFSLLALAAPFRPKKVVEISPALGARFGDEALVRLLDPKGAVYRLVAGLEVGAARVAGRQVIVDAVSPRVDGGLVRFRVAWLDGGPPSIIRIE